MTEAEIFITQRFGDLLREGEISMLNTPQGLEKLKNILLQRVKQQRQPVPARS